MKRSFAVFASATLLVSLTFAQSPEALLSKTFKAYRSLSGLSISSTIVVEQKMEETSVKQTMIHKATYQRPNLLRVQWNEGGGRGGITIVGDGKNLFTQIDALKQVKKETAPKTLREIVRSGSQGALVIDELSCFIGEDRKDKVKMLKIAGKETLNRRATTKLQITFKDGSLQTLWIDENGLIWKNQRRLERSHPAGGKISIVVTETFNEVITNPKLPKSFFSYKIPPGFKQVTEFQVPKTPPEQK